MALIDPPNNGDNNDDQKYMGEEFRTKVLNQLALSKQFSIRQQLNSCDSLSRDQAVEFLKDAIVQLAYKDLTFASIMKSEWT